MDMDTDLANKIKKDRADRTKIEWCQDNIGRWEYLEEEKDGGINSVKHYRIGLRKRQGGNREITGDLVETNFSGAMIGLEARFAKGW